MKDENEDEDEDDDSREDEDAGVLLARLQPIILIFRHVGGRGFGCGCGCECGVWGVPPF